MQRSCCIGAGSERHGRSESAGERVQDVLVSAHDWIPHVLVSARSDVLSVAEPFTGERFPRCGLEGPWWFLGIDMLR